MNRSWSIPSGCCAFGSDPSEWAVTVLLELTLNFRTSKAVLHAQADDLTSDLGSGKVKSWSAIKLDVLCWKVLASLQEAAVDTEQLHGKATGRRIAVLIGISRDMNDECGSPRHCLDVDGNSHQAMDHPVPCCIWR